MCKERVTINAFGEKVAKPVLIGIHGLSKALNYLSTILTQRKLDDWGNYT